MSGRILSRVLSFTEGHIRWRLDDLGPTRLRLFAVSIDIRNGDMDVLGDTVGRGSAIWSALSTQHQCSLSNGELRVADHAAALCPKAF